MAKRGKPEDYLEVFHPNDFLEQSEQGRDIKQIAKRWKVSRSTIYGWAKRHPEFEYTIKIGKELCEGWYMDLGQAAMVGEAKMNGKPIKVDLGWFCWMTKNIFKWSDKVETKTEHSGSVHQSLSKVSEAKVKAILEKFNKDY